MSTDVSRSGSSKSPCARRMSASIVCEYRPTGFPYRAVTPSQPGAAHHDPLSRSALRLQDSERTKAMVVCPSSLTTRDGVNRATTLGRAVWLQALTAERIALRTACSLAGTPPTSMTISDGHPDQRRARPDSSRATGTMVRGGSSERHEPKHKRNKRPCAADALLNALRYRQNERWNMPPSRHSWEESEIVGNNPLIYRNRRGAGRMPDGRLALVRPRRRQCLHTSC